MATPSWWKGFGPDRPKSVSLQDYVQQFLTNKAIQYMVDPSTQVSTAQFLARDNPMQFGGYGGMGAAKPPPVSQYAQNKTLRQMSPAWFANVIHNLDPNVIKTSLPASVKTDFGKDENMLASKDTDASLRWLNEYLKTAGLAAGVGKGAPTRSTQQYVREHLGTLTKEAADSPSKAGKFLTLAENLINPVLARTPQSGIFGINRAASAPFGSRRMGEGFRNPFAL
jgi:hypothetical protein